MKFGIVESGSNATFVGSCTGTNPIAWCAFGITDDPKGGMYPAGAACYHIALEPLPRAPLCPVQKCSCFKLTPQGRLS